MRLQRIGKRGQAYFRIIVTEHTKKPQGEYLELLGSYDPHKKTLLTKKDRIEHWMSKGVQLSPTVNNLLVNNKKVTEKPAALAAAPKETKAAEEAPDQEAAPAAEPEVSTETPAE